MTGNYVFTNILFPPMILGFKWAIKWAINIT